MVSQTEAHDGLVSVDFPEPTDIKDIARAVALWTGKPMVLYREVHGKTQIHAPERVTKDVAYSTFLAALDEMGLVANEQHGVVQILPKKRDTPEHQEAMAEQKLPRLPPTENLVKLDVPEPTDIKDVVAGVAKWSGRRFVTNRDVHGKVQIINPKMQDKEQAYRVFLTALDSLGLTEVEKDGTVQIVPQRTLARSEAPSHFPKRIE
jgi:hypothetical protein